MKDELKELREKVECLETLLKEVLVEYKEQSEALRKLYAYGYTKRPKYKARGSVGAVKNC